MNKEQFLELLKNNLTFLNQNDVKVHLDFYDKLISNRVDEGITEFEVVKDLGDITDIITLIKKNYGNEVEAENEVIQQNDNTTKNGKKSILFVIISILGFPIWFPTISTIAVLLVFLIVGIFVFTMGGLQMLLSTFSMLNSPIPTIIFNVGLSCLFISLGLLFIPLSKYYFKFTKNCYVKFKTYIKGIF